jgi:hypothetical protein
MYDGPVGLGHAQVGADAFLRPQNARAGLEISRLVVGDVELREPLPDLSRIENFVADPVLLRRRDGVCKKLFDVRDRRLLGAGNDQPAAGREERRSLFALELAPQLVRAHRQWRVLRTLADCQARDARVAVARTQHMRRREAVDAKNAPAKPGEMIDRRAAHRAKPEHDGVESCHADLCRARRRASLARSR